MSHHSLPEKTCAICANKIKDGLSILDSFICLPCELILLSTPVGSLDYMTAVQGIKQIWQKSGVKVADGD